MLATELEVFWSKLSLIEGEQNTVEIEAEWVKDTLARGQCCLIGRVLTKKPIYLEVMRSVLVNIWRLLTI
ncbi:hypothetical protein REPUB_Repub07fG0081300 [Reevesia pubescens]